MSYQLLMCVYIFGDTCMMTFWMLAPERQGLVLISPWIPSSCYNNLHIVGVPSPCGDDKVHLDHREEFQVQVRK